MIIPIRAMVGSTIEDAFEGWDEDEDRLVMWDSDAVTVMVPCEAEEPCEDATEVETECEHNGHAFHSVTGVHVHLCLSTKVGTDRTMEFAMPLTTASSGGLFDLLTRIRTQVEFDEQSDGLGDVEAAMAAILAEHQQ